MSRIKFANLINISGIFAAVGSDWTVVIFLYYVMCAELNSAVSDACLDTWLLVFGYDYCMSIT